MTVPSLLTTLDTDSKTRLASPCTPEKRPVERHADAWRRGAAEQALLHPKHGSASLHTNQHETINCPAIHVPMNIAAMLIIPQGPKVALQFFFFLQRQTWEMATQPEDQQKLIRICMYYTNKIKCSNQMREFSASPMIPQVFPNKYSPAG